MKSGLAGRLWHTTYFIENKWQKIISEQRMAPPHQILFLCCQTLPIKNWGKQTKENRDLLITYRKSGIPATQRRLKATRKEMKGNGRERNCENFTTKRLYLDNFEHIHFIYYFVLTLLKKPLRSFDNLR